MEKAVLLVIFDHHRVAIKTISQWMYPFDVPLGAVTMIPHKKHYRYLTPMGCATCRAGDDRDGVAAATAEPSWQHARHEVELGVGAFDGAQVNPPASRNASVPAMTPACATCPYTS